MFREGGVFVYVKREGREGDELFFMGRLREREGATTHLIPIHARDPLEKLTKY